MRVSNLIPNSNLYLLLPQMRVSITLIFFFAIMFLIPPLNEMAINGVMKNIDYLGRNMFFFSMSQMLLETLLLRDNFQGFPMYEFEIPFHRAIVLLPVMIPSVFMMAYRLHIELPEVLFKIMCVWVSLIYGVRGRPRRTALKLACLVSILMIIYWFTSKRNTEIKINYYYL